MCGISRLDHSFYFIFNFLNSWGWGGGRGFPVVDIIGVMNCLNQPVVCSNFARKIWIIILGSALVMAGGL